MLRRIDYLLCGFCLSPSIYGLKPKPIQRIRPCHSSLPQKAWLRKSKQPSTPKMVRNLD